MTNYQDSLMYQKGKMFKEFGELLMDPATTIRNLADFSLRWGVEVDLMMAVAPGISAAQGEGGD